MAKKVQEDICLAEIFDESISDLVHYTSKKIMRGSKALTVEKLECKIAATIAPAIVRFVVFANELGLDVETMRKNFEKDGCIWKGFVNSLCSKKSK
jgi:hypothetical protein